MSLHHSDILALKTSRQKWESRRKDLVWLQILLQVFQRTRFNCAMSPSISLVERKSCIKMSLAKSPEEAKPDGVMSLVSSQEDTACDYVKSTASFPKDTKSDSLMSRASSPEDTKLDSPSHTRIEEVTKPSCLIPLAKCSKETQSASLASCKGPGEKHSAEMLCHVCPKDVSSASQLCCKRCHCASCTGQGRSQARVEIVKSEELLLLQLDEVKAQKKIPIRLIPPGAASRLPLTYKTLVLRMPHYKGECFAMAASLTESSDGSLTIMRSL